MSNKTAHYRAQSADRYHWLAEQQPHCMVCGKYTVALEIHELERRSQCSQPFNRNNYLAVCRLCHSGPLAAMPHDRQLAYKLLADPDHFDLIGWLRLSDPELKAPRRVTLREIVDELKRIMGDR